MSAPFEIVFFDAFGTLIYLPTTVGAHYREIGLRHGIDLSADELNRAFRARWKTAPPRLATQDGPRQDDDKGWWRELVQQVIADIAPADKVSSLNFSSYFEELYGHFAQPGVWAVFPEIHKVLTALKRRGLRLGIISNFDRRLYQILDGLALTQYFSYIVISSEVGADKPDARIFKTALSRAGAHARTAVHVGDEPERDWGAEAVGMTVYKLRRPDENLDALPPWLEARSSRENGLATSSDLS